MVPVSHHGVESVQPVAADIPSVRVHSKNTHIAATCALLVAQADGRCARCIRSFA